MLKAELVPSLPPIIQQCEGLVLGIGTVLDPVLEEHVHDPTDLSGRLETEIRHHLVPVDRWPQGIKLFSFLVVTSLRTSSFSSSSNGPASRT